MEGLRFIKIIIFSFSILLLIMFFISCQSPLFQSKYNAKNDLITNTQYHDKYISKNNVGQHPDEKLNVYITNDNDIGIYIWIGKDAFPTDNDQRFYIKSSDIDGEFPSYAFNNEELVGKLSIVNLNVISITFATLYPPYLNIQNVICNRVK